MKIAVMSDLHLEFDQAWAEREHRVGSVRADDAVFRPPAPAADLVVLAGDVHTGWRAFDWAQRNFSIPTILIGGNHEPFGCELFSMIALNRHKSRLSDHRTIFLERESHEVLSASGERVRFIGMTLWTDFLLYGTPAESMAAADASLADFVQIKIERGHKFRALTALDTTRLHRASLEFLRIKLEAPFEGITVVISHHAPSPSSIAPRFAGSPLNPAFTSNLEDLIRRYEPALWIHGHVHDSFDYKIGRTRVICNPRGYFPHELNPLFDPLLVVQT